MEDVNISGQNVFFVPLHLSSVAKNSIPEKFLAFDILGKLK